MNPFDLHPGRTSSYLIPTSGGSYNYRPSPLQLQTCYNSAPYAPSSSSGSPASASSAGSMYDNFALSPLAHSYEDLLNMPLYVRQQQHAPTPRTPGPGPYHNYFSTGEPSGDSSQYFFTPPLATAQPRLQPIPSSTESTAPPSNDLAEGSPEPVTALLHAESTTSSVSDPTTPHPSTAEDGSTLPKHADGESADATIGDAKLCADIHVDAESDALGGVDVVNAPVVDADADTGADTVAVAVKTEPVMDSVIDLSDS